MTRDKVFISYSHRDKRWLTRLQKMLKPLIRGGTIDLWADTEIKAGANWKEEIESALLQARVAVLLVSADFLASDFVVEEELPPLLRAADEEGVTILWVYLSPCHFGETTIAEYQAAHDVAKSLMELPLPKQERALLEISGRIKDAVVEAERQVEEREQRLRAEAEARRRAEEEEQVRQAEAEAKRKAEAEQVRQAEAEAKRKAEAEQVRRAEAEAKRKAEAEEQRRQAAATARRKAEKKDQQWLDQAVARREAEQAERPRQLEDEKRRRAEAAVIVVPELDEGVAVRAPREPEPPAGASLRSKQVLWIGGAVVLVAVILLLLKLRPDLEAPTASLTAQPASLERGAGKPPAKQRQESPKPKAKKVPIPDPPPPNSEPIRLEKPEPEIDLPDIDDIVFGIPDAPPVTEPEGRIHTGGDVKKPEKIFGLRPSYTEEAKELRIQGVVIVQTIIDKNGNVTNIKVLKGLPNGLSEQAVKALEQWKFKPATLNGKPVDVYYNLAVNFRLQ